MEALKATLAKLEQKDIDNGDFERKSQVRQFYRALYGLDLTPDSVSEPLQSELTDPPPSPKRLRLNERVNVGREANASEECLIQAMRSNGWQKRDFQVFFETCSPDRVRPVLQKAGLTLGVVEMCSLCQALVSDPLQNNEQFALICETLIVPNLMQEDVIIREVAQSVISLAEIEFDLVVQSILRPLFEVNPVAHPEVILTFIQDGCPNEESRLLVFKTFLQSRELLQDPDLMLLECFLQKLDPQSVLPNELLLSLCPVLVASTSHFRKNAKFGKLLLSICKKLPSILDQRTLDSFQTTLTTHQTFVRAAAQKELKSRTIQ